MRGRRKEAEAARGRRGKGAEERRGRRGKGDKGEGGKRGKSQKREEGGRRGKGAEGGNETEVDKSLLLMLSIIGLQCMLRL